MSTKTNFPDCPQICIEGDYYVMTGVLSSPLRLWSREERDNAVQKNVDLAMKGQASGGTPFFVGIEHLGLLVQVWPQGVSAVVIEKSKTYADSVLKDLVVPENISVVTGDLGFFVPFTESSAFLYQNTFYFEEIGCLAYKLLALPDPLFKRIHLFTLPEHALEQEYHTQLYRALYSVVAAKRFHHENEAVYAAYRLQQKTDQVVFLVIDDAEAAGLEQHYGRIVSASQRCVFVVGDYGDPLYHQQLFARERVMREDLFKSGVLDRVLAPFQNNALRLFAQLCEQRPAWVGWRNRAPFNSLEDVLFAEEMLRRLNIPVRSFFSDILSTLCLLFQGGWSYCLHRDLWPAEHSLFFSVDPIHDGLFKPERFQTSHYPDQRFSHDFRLVPPVSEQKELNRDICLVHGMRSFHLGIACFNELYEMVTTLTDNPNKGQALLVFTHALRARLKAFAQEGGNSYYWQTLINTMDFNFYSQARMRRVRDLVARLNSFNLRVYGEGWNAILPAECCGGQVTGADLIEVYRRSCVTINVTLDRNFYDPHPNVFECLASGGLPLLAYPALSEIEEALPIFHGQDKLLYYRDDHELEALVKKYVSDFEARQHYIKQAQTTWLVAMQQRSLNAVDQNLLATPVDFPKKPVPCFCLDPVRADFVLQAAVGYLNLVSGYLGASMVIWQELMMRLGISYKPLVQRAIKTAQEIGDSEKEAFFRATFSACS